MIAEKLASKSRPMALLSAGHYHQAAGCHPRPNAIPKGVERVELLTGGRGWVEMDGAWIEVTTGALLWHVKGDRTIARSDWGDPYRCLAVNFEVRTPKGYRRVPRLTWWRDAEEVQRFAVEVVRGHVDEQFDRESLHAYVYGRLLFQARRWERSGHYGNLPGKLKQALEIIEKDDATALSLSELARRIGWSVAYLHEMFRANLGTTPHQAVLQRRIRMARERLVATDQPVKQIASECGFANAAAFCHAFKARVGMPPLEYRRRETMRDLRAVE